MIRGFIPLYLSLQVIACLAAWLGGYNFDERGAIAFFMFVIPFAVAVITSL